MWCALQKQLRHQRSASLRSLSRLFQYRNQAVVCGGRRHGGTLLLPARPKPRPLLASISPPAGPSSKSALGSALFVHRRFSDSLSPPLPRVLPPRRGQERGRASGRRVPVPGRGRGGQRYGWLPQLPLPGVRLHLGHQALLVRLLSSGTPIRLLFLCDDPQASTAPSWPPTGLGRCRDRAAMGGFPLVLPWFCFLQSVSENFLLSYWVLVSFSLLSSSSAATSSS